MDEDLDSPDYDRSPEARGEGEPMDKKNEGESGEY